MDMLVGLKLVLVWRDLVDLVRWDEIPGEEETIDTTEPVLPEALECVDCEKTNNEVAVVDVECNVVDGVLDISEEGFTNAVLILKLDVVKSVV